MFLFLLGVAICLGSLQIDYGKAVNPGPGFLPFWCGAIISMLSLVLFFHRLLKKSEGTNEDKGMFKDVAPTNPLLILGAMVLYSLLFNTLGFSLSNLLFLALLFRFVWKKRWGFILSVCLLIGFAFYVTFEVLIKVQLPKGVLGFF